MAITESVPTDYAGCRFRSRLESRWAVFFDAAGIAWEYEPRGFAISRRGRLLTNYLPDFWLPDAGQYLEVKGFLFEDAFERLLLIARVFASRGTDLVVLSDIPSVWTSRWPCQLHLADGELAAVPWEPFRASPDLRRAIRERCLSPGLLLDGFPIVIPEWSEPALEVARWYEFPPTSGPRARSLGYGRSRPA